MFVLGIAACAIPLLSFLTQPELELTDLDHQLASGQASPSAHDAADRLTRMVAAARRAGAIISSASRLGTAITTIAHWLGPAGTTVNAPD
jgi:hypothetical protein